MICAYSSLCSHYIDGVLELGLLNYYNAVEWDLNYIPPTIDTQRIDYVRTFIANNALLIRYHLPYSFVDIAHYDTGIRRFSISVTKNYLDFINALGGSYAVLHIAGHREVTDERTALNMLSMISQYARKRQISLCIENMSFGMSSNLAFLRKALSVDNVSLCLDFGHVLRASQNDEHYIEDIINLIPYCTHAHVYKLEDKNRNHIAFCSLEETAESVLVKELLRSRCCWMTMETDSLEDQESQVVWIKNLLGH